MVRITRRRFVETAAVGAGGALIASVAGRLDVPLAAAAVPTRAFGHKGFTVSAIGFGGGGRFFEPVTTDEEGAELVRKAIDGGMTFIETSAAYGPDTDDGQSERRIGLAMKTHRQRAFIETKTDQRDYDGAMREMERSLTRLQTDHIDLMFHHNLSRPDFDKVIAANGAEKAIRKMVDQKVVRYRGFSCHDPALTVDAIERLEPDALQAPINATRVPDFEARVLPLCATRGIAVVAMKVVGHGFFLKAAVDGSFDSRFKTDDHLELHRFAPPKEAFEKAPPTPTDYLHYAMSLPLTVVLVGIDSRATLDSVLTIASTFSPLAASKMGEINRRAQALATTGYWIPRPPSRTVPSTDGQAAGL
jgi:aryl-alcohol dehydrogenase-like predicted oxidoreductase